MPKRTINGEGKKISLNMRTTAALRAKIDKAAGKSGRSLVQEVEYRVEQSFVRDEWGRRCMELINAQNRVAERMLKLEKVCNGR